MRWSLARVLMIAVYWAIVPIQAQAAKHWAQTYIDARGGCHNQLPVVTAETPFGKLAADWSDDDLRNLALILSDCVKTRVRSRPDADASYVDFVREQAEAVLRSTSEFVQSARAERARQEARLAARKEIAQGRIAAAREQAEKKRFDAEAEVQQLEAEAKQAEAEARLAQARQEEARRVARDRIARAENQVRPLEPETRPSNKGGGDMAASGNQCEIVTARVMERTGAVFIRQSTSTRFLRHSLLGEGLTVYCYLGRIAIDARWERGTLPSNQFFEVAATAGAVLNGDAPVPVRLAMGKCHQKALARANPADPENMHDKVAIGNAMVECVLGSEDGGWASFTITRPDPSAEVGGR